MGFQTLEILRQGVWASITGGWFYDPHHDLFSNTFHLYSWIFLILLPFLIHLWSSSSTVWYLWVAYVGVIFITFSVMKIINLRLHLMFDTSESIEERPKDAKRNMQTSSDVEDIELQVLDTKDARNRVESSLETAPSFLPCGLAQTEMNENATLDGPLRGRGETCSPSDQSFTNCDVQVDVHRKNSMTGANSTLLATDVQEEKPTRQPGTKPTCHYEELFSAQDSFSPGAAVTSLKSVESEEAEKAPRNCIRLSSGGSSGRRFSNISNLAFELSSTAISAPRLQGGGGSVELGFVLEGDACQMASKSSARPVGGLPVVRRTLSALETSTGTPLALPASTASAPQY